MAARVGQAGGPVSFGHSPRRRERPAAGGARLVVQSNVLYPKGAVKPVSPPTAKGRSPTFAKSASSSPPPGANNYAGPKFSEPPSPAALPQPPTHWVAPLPDVSNEVCLQMTNQLKMLLKVNA
ncbi:uncharacterized protein LOC144156235 [Haemaphysalis longicornis]